MQSCIYIIFIYADDYEDIWPKCEQPATYLNKLLHWRPQNIVPLEDFEEKDDHICVLEEDDWELKGLFISFFLHFILMFQFLFCYFYVL